MQAQYSALLRSFKAEVDKSLYATPEFISYVTPYLEDSSTLHIFQRSASSDFFTVHGAAALHIADSIFRDRHIIVNAGTPRQPIPSLPLNQTLFEQVVVSAILAERMGVQLHRLTRKTWESVESNFSQLLQDYVERMWSENRELETFAAYSSAALVASIVATDVGLTITALRIDFEGMRCAVYTLEDSVLLSRSFAPLVTRVGVRETHIVLRGGAQEAVKASLERIAQESNLILSVHEESEFGSVGDDFNRFTRWLSHGLPPHFGSETYRRRLEPVFACAASLMEEKLGDRPKVEEDAKKEESGPLFEITEVSSCGMKLYPQDIRALSLLPPPPRARDLALGNTKAGGKSSVDSIFNLLDKTHSRMGSRYLGRLIREPLTDPKEISHRHDLLSALVEDHLLRLHLSSAIRDMPDIDRSIGRLRRGAGEFKDVLSIYRGIFIGDNVATRIANTLSEGFNCNNRDAEIAWKNEQSTITALLDKLSNFRALVEETVDLSMIQRNECVVRSDLDPRLERLRRKWSSAERKLDRVIDEAADLIGVKRDRIRVETRSVGGRSKPVMRLPRSQLRAVQSANLYEVVETRASYIKFVSEPFETMNEKLDQVKTRYKELQRSIEQRIIDVAADFCGEIAQFSEEMAKIDVMIGLGIFVACQTRSWVRPIILEEDGRVRCTGLRHPLVEAQIGDRFVPNDVALGGQKEEKSEHLCLITGSNSSGKSVYLKSVGVAAVLNQIGCYIPAERAEISIFDQIGTRVGSGDAINRSLSSFMLEMSELSLILDACRERSLVLLDEVGRATAVEDGHALAMAISEWVLQKNKSTCLFATHIHQLTVLEQMYPGAVVNLHTSIERVVEQKCEMEEENKEIGDQALDDPHTGDMMLTYKVLPGVSTRSFGILCARKCGYPEEVLELAAEGVRELEKAESRSGRAKGLVLEPAVFKSKQ